jgi:hypothetical protein
MCDISLFLKNTLSVAQRVRKNSLKNIFYFAKQNRGRNKPLPITTQTQLKQQIFFTSRAASFMSKRQSLKVTSVNITGDGFDMI